MNFLQSGVTKYVDLNILKWQKFILSQVWWLHQQSGILSKGSTDNSLARWGFTVYLLLYDVVISFSVSPSTLPICLLRTHTDLEWFNLNQLSLCWEEHAKISSFPIQLSLQQGQHPAIYFQSVMIALQSSQKAMAGLILEVVLKDFFHCTQCKGCPLKLCKKSDLDLFLDRIFFFCAKFFFPSSGYLLNCNDECIFKTWRKTWEILAITEGHKLRLSCSCSECYLYNTAIITGPDVKSSIELNKLNQTEHSRHLFLLVCNPFLIGLNHNWFSFKTLFSLSPFIQVLW